MTKPHRRKVLVAGVVLLVVAGGAAAAVLARERRDVTTASAEAYKLYERGLEDERRLYHKDALASYAKALQVDPGFTMAMLRLAGNIAGRDRARAESLVQYAARNPGSLNEREKLVLGIYEAELLGRDMKKSGELIREYVKRFPDDPEGYYRLAGVLAREGKTEETLSTYERLLSLDPNQAVAYNFLGYYFMGRRDFVKAEDYLKRYRFLAPDQANPFDSLGELYANTGRYDEAVEHLRKALEIKPDFIPSIAHLGTVEIGRGNPAAAADWFHRAYQLSESTKDKQTFAAAAAMALVDAGRSEEALALFSEPAPPPSALSPKEQFGTRWNLARTRAVLLALAGRPDEAEAELAGLPEIPADTDPKERASLETSLLGPKAAIAGARGDLEGAVALLRKILVEEKGMGSSEFGYYPNGPRLRTRLAGALVTLGRPDEAREELRPVLAVNPRFAPALEVIARIEGRPGAAPGSAGR